jgi:hypothetical protein
MDPDPVSPGHIEIFIMLGELGGTHPEPSSLKDLMPDPENVISNPELRNFGFVLIILVLRENQGFQNISLFGNEKVGNSEKSVYGKLKLRIRTAKKLRIVAHQNYQIPANPGQWIARTELQTLA